MEKLSTNHRLIQKKFFDPSWTKWKLMDKSKKKPFYLKFYCLILYKYFLILSGINDSMKMTLFLDFIASNYNKANLSRKSIAISQSISYHIFFK